MTISLTNYEMCALDGARTMGWFDPDKEIWRGAGDRTSYVRRPGYIARMLLEAGKLESRAKAGVVEYRVKGRPRRNVKIMAEAIT